MDHGSNRMDRVAELELKDSLVDLQQFSLDSREMAIMVQIVTS